MITLVSGILAGCGAPAPPAADPSDAAAPRDVPTPSDTHTTDRETPPADAPPPPPFARRLPDHAVVAWVAAGETAAWWIEERLTAIPWRSGDREVGPRRLVRASGDAPSRTIYEPAAQERLITAVLHPSGAWSAAVATADFGVALVRGAADGAVRARRILDDPALAADTAAWRGDEAPSRLMLNARSEDSLRLATDGEDVVLTLTTRWDSALAYRWRWAGGDWARGPRTLLAPASPLPVFIPDTASYDVFDAVLNPWSTHVCVDATGTAQVALWVDHPRLRAINAAFGTTHSLRVDGPPMVERPSDILVVPVARSGARGAARVVGVANVDDEAYGIACGGTRVAVVGRHRREVGRDNTELHALLALLDGANAEPVVRSFDGDQNAIAQTVTLDDDGTVWVGGTESWTQNPVGVSVSGPGRPLLLRWRGGAGDAPTRVSLPTLRGHAELRAVVMGGRALWLGGIEDGPVTHTFDGDRAALRGGGWAHALPVPRAP